MLYAIFCYDSESEVGAWTPEQDKAAIEKLAVVQEKLSKQGRLGPVARLAPTKRARTVKKGRDAFIVDGPFAETKEALLGFFVVDCANEQEAIEAAQELGRASSSGGSYEVRPFTVFLPGATFPALVPTQ
ncbi:RNA polymerase sigma-70 factor, ECF subfamily [Labilithrix luteola]|uniref:RNA polymerase sigma-70 factor, ECF subfamily n=1 Tax=Labilithrix luteola TaxID=1391654 RepID=A0A0K1PSS0_9BACT|nr:YciI family protein [Labilithrix luteola]AKU96583.1 RNA polymerase sigma-70 factor, ECF subfamily [Labilithrix luteola]